MIRHRRPRLEILESRDTPGNLTVTYAVATHTLTVVGHQLNNQLSVDGVDGNNTQFRLESTTDTFNGSPGPLITPTGVKNLSIKLLGGDDTIVMGSAATVTVLGNLTVAGADGKNKLNAYDLLVYRNLTITNGAGVDATYLSNLNVFGSLIINNGTGDSEIHIYRGTPGWSLIQGNLTILNGTGQDHNNVIDMNVGGNVTIRNGRGDSYGNGGDTSFYNIEHKSSRSVIGGNVLVSYSDGNATDWFRDVSVLGNVTFNHGTGSSDTVVDKYNTALPTVVRGNLTFAGSGPTIIHHDGTANIAGMVIGRDFRVTGGSGVDQLYLFRAEVGGRTILALGDGNNHISIDDSLFVGVVSITTGVGNDSVYLEAILGSATWTTFEKPVTIRQGAGNDLFHSSGTVRDINQFVQLFAPVIVHSGAGTNEFEVFPYVHFPLGVGIEQAF